MAHNRYFVVEATDPNLPEIEKVIVGELDTQRKSLDKKFIIVKLHDGDPSDYPFLDKYKELTHEEAINLMATIEWQLPIE